MLSRRKMLLQGVAAVVALPCVSVEQTLTLVMGEPFPGKLVHTYVYRTELPPVTWRKLYDGKPFDARA